MASIRACLEQMPVEIRLSILKEGELFSLYNLIQASRAYNEAYQGSKDGLLCHFVARGFGNYHMDVLDPLIAIQAANLQQHSGSNAAYIDKAETLLDEWGRFGENAPTKLPRLAYSDLLALIHLQHVVESLCQKFCEDILTQHPLHTNGIFRSYEEPSPTELRRIHRALYRWEIYAQLYGRPFAQGRFNYPQESEDVCRQAELLLGHLPWHEGEELSAVLEHAVGEYVGLGIFDNVPQEVRSDPLQPFGRPSYQNQMALVALGPQLLFNILNLPIEEVYEFATPMIALCPSYGLNGVLEIHNGALIKNGNPAPRFKGEDRQPNIVWQWLAEDDASDDFTDDPFQDNTSLLGWAYVMWDRERLDRWGITKKDLVERPRSDWGP